MFASLHRGDGNNAVATRIAGAYPGISTQDKVMLFRPTFAAVAIGLAVMPQAGPDLGNRCDGRVGFSFARFIGGYPNLKPVEYTPVVGVRNTWTRPFSFTATIDHGLFTST